MLQERNFEVVLVRSIFNSPAQILVNPVNCVGVMGRGLAKDFAIRYPEMLASYIKRCTEGFKPGELHLWKMESEDRYIVNFPTKDHWRNPSRIEYIVKGLEGLHEICKMLDVRSIAIPALGCGLGQLDWVLVKSLILSEFEGSGIELDLYDPM